MQDLKIDLIFEEMIRKINYSNFLIDYHKIIDEKKELN